MNKYVIIKGALCILGGPIGTIEVLAGEYLNKYYECEDLKQKIKNMDKYLIKCEPLEPIKCNIDKSLKN